MPRARDPNDSDVPDNPSPHQPGGSKYCERSRRRDLMGIFHRWRLTGEGLRDPIKLGPDYPQHPLTTGFYQHPQQPGPEYGSNKPLDDDFGEAPFGAGFSPGHETSEFRTHDTAPLVVNALQDALAVGGLRLVRILGWGGNGLACLFAVDLEDGKTDFFVVKAALDDGGEDGPDPNRGLYAEKVCTALYEGAMHVVQLKSIKPGIKLGEILTPAFLARQEKEKKREERRAARAAQVAAGFVAGGPAGIAGGGGGSGAGARPRASVVLPSAEIPAATPALPSVRQRRATAIAPLNLQQGAVFNPSPPRRATSVLTPGDLQRPEKRKNPDEDDRQDSDRPDRYKRSRTGRGPSAHKAQIRSNIMAKRAHIGKGGLLTLSSSRSRRKREPTILAKVGQAADGAPGGGPPRPPAFVPPGGQQGAGGGQLPPLRPQAPYPPGALPAGHPLAGGAGRGGPVPPGGWQQHYQQPGPPGFPGAGRGRAEMPGMTGPGMGRGGPVPPEFPDPPPLPRPPFELPGPDAPTPSKNFFLLDPQLPTTLPDLGPDRMMVMEYLKHGTLSHILWTVCSRNLKIPSRTLWYMFMCMIRGLIGMNYPPKQYHTDRANISRTNLWSESMPMRGKYPSTGGTRTVHFDIDPSNFFVGDLGVGPGSDDHKLCPIIKLADFGLAECFHNKQDNGEELWEQRVMAKNHHLTPEQWSQEWDWIKQCPKDSTASRFTAGRYDTHTNIYQVALTMACLITLKRPQVPPVPANLTLIRVTHFPSIMRWDEAKQGPRPTVRGWTYGSYLLTNHPDWLHVDGDLRNVVAQCMFDAPHLRPTLQELYYIAVMKLRAYEAANLEHGPDHDDWGSQGEFPMEWAREPLHRQPIWTDAKIRAFITEVLENPEKPPSEAGTDDLMEEWDDDDEDDDGDDDDGDDDDDEVDYEDEEMTGT